MPRQPRGKRIGSDDHEFSVVSKNSNGDGSVYFEPGRTENDGRVRKGMWRATYRDAAGKIKRVSGQTRVAVEVRRAEKLIEIESAPKVGSRHQTRLAPRLPFSTPRSTESLAIWAQAVLSTRAMKAVR